MPPGYPVGENLWAVAFRLIVKLKRRPLLLQSPLRTSESTKLAFQKENSTGCPKI